MAVESEVPRPDDAAARAALSRQIGAEMDAIFAGVRLAEAGPTRAYTRMAANDLHRRGGPRLASLGAIAAAALVGVAGGALIGRSPDPRPRTAQVALATPAPVLPIEVRTPEPAPLPQTTLLPTVDPALVPAATRPKPAVTRAAHSCAAGRCTRAEVMAADRRLRAAYARAIRAGVPRRVLVNYRDRWARLRWTSSDEPHRLVDGYRLLASGLARAAQDERGRHS